MFLNADSDSFVCRPAVLRRFLRGATAAIAARGACRVGGCGTNLGPLTGRLGLLLFLHVIVMLLRLEVSCRKNKANFSRLIQVINKSSGDF